MPAKIYNSAPLPFMGQKRRFVNQFREALREFSSATTFVDLFGGSGLLSHITKRERPDARVIYNDFDDYHLRVENVDRTNAIIIEIGSIIGQMPKLAKLPDEKKARIIAILEEYEKTGFVDYITISSSLLFSANFVSSLSAIRNATFYNRVTSGSYASTGYLDGLEIVKYDYRELFDQYKDIPGVVFLVDPPYLSTEAGVYKGYWRLRDYLDVLRVIDGHPYVYFTSDKSHIVDLIEWMQSNTINGNPFAGATRKELDMTINNNSQYKDIMLYRA